MECSICRKNSFFFGGVTKRPPQFLDNVALPANSRPPTFIVYTSQLNRLPDSYSKYLINRLRIDFKLPGTPIRIITRKSDNPFTHR